MLIKAIALVATAIVTRVVWKRVVYPWWNLNHKQISPELSEEGKDL